MKTKLGLAVALVTAAVVLSACMSTETREAKKMLESYVEANTLRCGDSYYYVSYGCIIEVKGLRFHAEAEELTQADRANGIEWHGWLRLTCNMRRSWECETLECETGLGGPRSQWYDCDGSSLSSFTIGSIISWDSPLWVSKRDGEWYYHSTMPYFSAFPPTPSPPDFTCEDVSQ